MSGYNVGNAFGAVGAQGYGLPQQGLGQQQIPQQNLADVVGRVTQAAVPVILSVLQNNPQLAQNAGIQGQQNAGIQGQWAGLGQPGLVNQQLNPFHAFQQQNGQLGQNAGLQGQSAGFGQQNTQFNPLNAGLQQQGVLQNGGADINRLLGGQQAQHLTNAVIQHVAQQLPQIIIGLIHNLAASQQLRGQAAGPGGQISPQSFAGDIGTWLGGAAQAIAAAAAQQLAQQLPIVIGNGLAALQAQSVQGLAQQVQPQQNLQFGNQGINPGLFASQPAQSAYAYH
jgi:hypothetical protein